jgi:cardiolipin synthase
MSLRHLPNLLCVFRILLVYPIGHRILEGRYPEVLVLVAVAAFTDALDGFLAKRFDWESELGKLLDPIADKLLLVTTFVCLSVADLAPWWLTALVLLRDLVIGFGAATYRALFGELRGRPTMPSKLNTLAQITFCLGTVAHAAFGWLPDALLTAAGALVLVTTAVSGIDYVLIYSRRAAAVARSRAAALR